MNKELFIIDNALDEIEFRNYVSALLIKNGYKDVNIDDPRLINGMEYDDNDMTAKKGNKKYTIQTYLNTNISEVELDDAIDDMEDEGADSALIITNFYCTKKIKDLAEDKNIEIIDREKLEQMMEK